MNNILNKLVEDIRTSCGTSLKSVVLYGSKAAGEETKKYSDYNILLVLENVNFSALAQLSAITGGWVRHGNTPPLIFTVDELKNSADVFPIEFLDMKASHRLLFGEDYLQNIEVKETHLRHQCEFELRSKLLKLRQGYLIAGGSSKKVRELLESTVSSFLVVFRFVLKLLGENPPLKKTDSLELLSKKTGINPSVFQTIIKIRNNDKEAMQINPEILIKEYMEEIEKIISVVDKESVL